MSKTNRLALLAAVMLTVVVGTNMLEANARTRFEKLRIAPAHKTSHARADRKPDRKPVPMPLMYSQRSVATEGNDDKLAEIPGSNSRNSID